MGLCKCRAATTHFCFNHKIHVCPDCIVSEHELCVIRSYIRWLADSDFENPHICSICTEPLTEGKTLRLTCLDAFHRDCVNKFCSTLPPHTAPAGYCCPKCKTPLLPGEERKSKITEQIRDFVSVSPWGKRVLTLSVSANNESKPPINGNRDTASYSFAPANGVRAAAGNNNNSNTSMNTTATSQQPKSAASILPPAQTSFVSRKGGKIDLEMGRDDDDDKNKSKSPIPNSSSSSNNSNEKNHAVGGAFTKPLMEKIHSVRNAALPLPSGMKADSNRVFVRRSLAIGLVALILVVLMLVMLKVQQSLPDASLDVDTPNFH